MNAVVQRSPELSLSTFGGCLRQNPYALYLAHISHGTSLRTLAKQTDQHPSTVLRKIRKIEDMREDPLIDQFLNNAAKTPFGISSTERFSNHMTAKSKLKKLTKEELRILRRLCETGAFLAIAPDLEKGAVFRTSDGNKPSKIAVVTREVAQSLTVKDCIKCTKNGTVAVYHATETGRALLRRALAKGQVFETPEGFEEQQSVFAGQHREFGSRMIAGEGREPSQKIRVNLRESPLAILARKKDKAGKPFLTQDMVQAADRLREDFELAQMGPNVGQNWESFLTPGCQTSYNPNKGGGSQAAADRLSKAMTALGMGLGDIVLRCCCFLEGVEAAEKRMGWSARSGKIVLRIALHKLVQHYNGNRTGADAEIG